MLCLWSFFALCWKAWHFLVLFSSSCFFNTCGKLERLQHFSLFSSTKHCVLEREKKTTQIVVTSSFKKDEEYWKGVVKRERFCLLYTRDDHSCGASHCIDQPRARLFMQCEALNYCGRSRAFFWTVRNRSW